MKTKKKETKTTLPVQRYFLERVGALYSVRDRVKRHPVATCVDGKIAAICCKALNEWEEGNQ